MIVGTLEALRVQVPALPQLQKALDWLITACSQEMADGRYEIDGNTVYALVQSYETLPVTENAKWEAHRNYIDVQFIQSGVEAMGWAPLAEMVVTKEYNPDKDVTNGTCPPAAATLVTVAAGQAAVFFPEDAHAPKLAVGAPAFVKKIVLKVAV